MRSVLVLITLIGLTYIACGGSREVEVPIAPTATSGVTGRVFLTAAGVSTMATVELWGLRSDATYRIHLQAGSCAQPSASFAEIADITADKDGRGSTGARLRFRDSDLDLKTVAGGSRIISVQLVGSGIVACGAIAALR